MTKFSNEERRARLGNSRDSSLKKFDDIFPDELAAANFRPRFMSAPFLPTLTKRCMSSPWEDPLPRVREESYQEVTAEVTRKPSTDLNRRHSWNLGVNIPNDLSNRLRSITIRVRSGSLDSKYSSSSSINSLPDVTEDEREDDADTTSDLCVGCGVLITSLDRRLSFIDDSLTEDDFDENSNSTAGTKLYCAACKNSKLDKNEMKPPSSCEHRRHLFSDRPTSRHGSLNSDSFDLPSISEPDSGNEADDSSEIKRIVEREMDNLVKFNQRRRLPERRKTIGCAEDVKRRRRPKRRGEATQIHYV